MTEEEISQSLHDQLTRERRTFSHGRYFLLLAIVAIGAIVYLGWRRRQPPSPAAAANPMAVVVALTDPGAKPANPEPPAPENLLGDLLLLPPALPPTPTSPAPPATEDFGAAAAEAAAWEEAINGKKVAPPSQKATDEVLLTLPETPAPTTPESTAPLDNLTGMLPPSALTFLPQPRPPLAAPLTPAPTPSGIKHRIQPGDSLPTLAKKYYGADAVADILRIRDANPQLQRGGFQVGAELFIPAGENLRGKNEISGVPPADLTPAAPPDNYTVRAGDTLSKIAAEIYGNPARWRELYAANQDRLARPDALKIGLVLRLPAAP
jgi:nucleoid-associated protein YgaU